MFSTFTRGGRSSLFFRSHVGQVSMASLIFSSHTRQVGLSKYFPLWNFEGVVRSFTFISRKWQMGTKMGTTEKGRYERVNLTILTFRQYFCYVGATIS